MFPNYKTIKKQKKFLWLNWVSEKKEGDGWKNLGKVNSIDRIINGKTITETLVHTICKTVLYVGKENGKVFNFCPLCMVKVN